MKPELKEKFEQSSRQNMARILRRVSEIIAPDADRRPAGHGTRHHGSPSRR